MKEMIEFRIPVEIADKELPAGLGVVLGSIRKVDLALEDPLVARIGSLQRQYNAEGKAFSFGWMIRRRYSRVELDNARLFHVWPRRTFEPAGEECGTLYDDVGACDHVFSRTPETEISGRRVPASIDSCGVGSRQVTPLFLDGRRIPRKADFSRTISGEIVVSIRVVQVFHEQGLSGAEFIPVRLSNRNGELSNHHYQWKVVGIPVELDSATRAGLNPFDKHAYGRCPRGHIAGLNLLSEVTVKTIISPDTDVMVTKQMIGVRRGLLRPQPLLLLSSRGWRAITNAKLNGLVTEIAHLP